MTDGGKKGSQTGNGIKILKFNALKNDKLSVTDSAMDITVELCIALFSSRVDFESETDHNHK